MAFIFTVQVGYMIQKHPKDCEILRNNKNIYPTDKKIFYFMSLPYLQRQLYENPIKLQESGTMAKVLLHQNYPNSNTQNPL